MELWGVPWSPVAFAIALLPLPLLFLFRLQNPKGARLPTLLVALPLVPACFLLHAQLPSLPFRALISFSFCWIIPNRLLLLCFDALDCPAWSFSTPSHFLLSILLPIRVKGPVLLSSPTLSSRLFLVLQELSALVCVFFCLILLPEYAKYPLFVPLTFLTLDVQSQALAILFHVLYGVELHAAFNSPWLPSSLADFWGRRWNLLGNALLRQSVYNPIVALLSGKKQRAGKGQGVELWVRLVGVWATFLCSGFIHELLWICVFQDRRWASSWENTWFFVLHGLATSAEISCRRLLPQLASKIPHFLQLAFTLAFVHTTMSWLLFAPVRAHPELYAIF